MQQLKVFLKEASHQELLPTIRRFVSTQFVFFQHAGLLVRGGC